jgi:hypothetical protein
MFNYDAMNLVFAASDDWIIVGNGYEGHGRIW